VVEAAAAVTTDVVVIGAGCAGLSAASRLAETGRRVIVVEAGVRLGGRASTFVDRETQARVDNGQHVLFGCYRETYAFLKRIGTDGLAPLDRALSVRMADASGRAHTLSCPRIPAPWHLAAGILKWSAVPFSARLAALSIARALGRNPASDGGSAATVTEWLRSHGQSLELCRWLWNPLAFAALNQSPDVALAAPFIRVLQEMFGPRPEDSAVGLPLVPLDELYAIPAARFVEQHHGSVLTGTAARIGVDDLGRITHVRAGDRSIEPRSVVCAVPWYALADVWDGTVPPAMAGIVDAATRMRPSPIVTVNLWFDRPVMRERFLGLVDGSMHWAFEKGNRLSVVSSGADELAAMSNDAIAAAAIDQVRRSIPGAGSAHVERVVVVKERRATFSLAAGEPRRAQTTTPVPGLFLAGDWIDTGLPATIESAVISGHRAAACVMSQDRSETRPRIEA
jgi:squalene-associated FAD-dependent desaturase